MTTENADSATQAVAYYRSSAADAEAAIESQREQVREWAEKRGIEIVREFVDAGTSGLDTEPRPGFDELMEWVKEDHDFRYILCQDVSRWGRFQGLDLSASYGAECLKAGKRVVYTTVEMPREDDPLFPVYLRFERLRAEQYRCELGAKIRRGRTFFSQKGYWTGGTPPYGLRRLLVDAKGNPLHLLEPGEQKFLQKQHVALVAGEPTEVAAIRRIFHEFVVLGYSTARIAERLNAKRIPSPGGDRWTARHVLACLRNKAYAASIAYRRKIARKTSRRGQTAGQWVHTPKARDGIISQETFQRAQEMLA